nr:right-handed parallel beta-helix repeat-containing protein [Acanthopleuribacter pedis]
MEQPWRTIAFATCGGTFGCPEATINPNLLQSGDTLYLRAGTYNESGIRVANAGSETQSIRITNYPGEEAIVDGGFTAPDGLAHQPVFEIDDTHHLVLEGLTIRRGLRSNIRIGYDRTATYITIKSCDMSEFVARDNSANIYINGGTDVITLLNNRLYDKNGDDGNSAGIIMFNAGRLYIANNTIFNTNQGIYYKHSQDNGLASVIENNLIYDQETMGLLVSNAETIIRHNVIFNVGGTGIWIFEESASCGFLASHDVSITHNTVIDPLRGIRLSRSRDCLGAVNTVVRDNLVAGFTNGEMRGLAIWPYHGFPDYLLPDESETTFDHNLIYGAGFGEPVRIINQYYAVDAAPLTGTGNLQQEPLFIDRGQGDYRLADGSPGKNAASDGLDMGADVNKAGAERQAFWKYWRQPIQLPFTVDHHRNRLVDVVELAAFVGN